MEKAIIFDIDGTLANLDHRLRHILKEPKDWDSFYRDIDKDQPIAPITLLCYSLFAMKELDKMFGYESEFQVVFCTGRPETYRAKTMAWLERYVLIESNPALVKLYMRKEGDFRPDAKVKEEMISQIKADGFEPFLVFEDRLRVVDMWRRHGVQCCQVAPGDF